MGKLSQLLNLNRAYDKVLKSHIYSLEPLSHMILEKVDQKLWQPVKSSRAGPKVSHLFFADDLFFFPSASEEEVTVIRETLV